MRLFFAIHPSQEACDEVHRLLRREARRLPSLRFGGSDKWHVTLQFLGEIDEERALVAERIAADVARQHPPFEAQLGSFGVFPNLRRPNVLWLGVAGEAALSGLAAGLGAVLRAEGFELETRDYHPHLTVARIKGRAEADEVRTFLEGAPSFVGSPFRVTGFSLLESRGGAYLPRTTWPLTGSRSG